MQIRVLFNSAAAHKGCSTGWGFSCLVDDRVLFDTGEKISYLARNLDTLAIDVSRLEAVVVSHDHWDHTGGLEEVLKRKPGLTVYICPHFSGELKEKIASLKGVVRECGDFTEVVHGIYVTGEIIGTYKQQDIAEQALVLDTEKGLTVITGCAHPDIVKIIEHIKQHFSEKHIYAVLGGFHLMDKTQRRIKAIVQQFTELGIKKAGPTHCSGTDAENIFQATYAENFLTAKVGENIDV